MSDHTVVEVVNDDMPFLVDSMTTEFARRTDRPFDSPAHHVDRDGGNANRCRRSAARETTLHAFAVTEQSGDRLADIQNDTRSHR